MQFLLRDSFRLTCLVTALLVCSIAPAVSAQILRGQWVDQTEQAIDKHRKDDITVIVLDRNDRPIVGAKLHIQQTRHAFALGLVIPADQQPPEDLRSLPCYRVINAIALDRLTQWKTADRYWADDIQDHLVQWHRAVDPIRIDFGPVVASDPANNFDGLAKLEPEDATQLIRQRVAASSELRIPVTHRDLYIDTAGSVDLREEFGIGLIHQLFEQAHADDPDGGLNLRFFNGLDSLNSRKIAERAQGYELRKLPITGITIEQQFTGQVQPMSLMRTLNDRTAILPAPVTLSGLEVGGTSEIAAALNLETVLRVLFAQPRIEAIYFNGLTADHTLDPVAALIGKDSLPTPSGKLVDDLFHKHWRTELRVATDDRGQANARVFKGWYQIEAELPDGSTLQTEAYIDQSSDRPRYIVIQQTAQ